MGMISHTQWSGSGFGPFSSPEPLAPGPAERKGMFVTDWATGVTQDESRHCPRHAIQHELLITDPDWWDTENPLPIRGQCLNMSEEGLYAVVPSGYGLAVGQRYLFHLRPENEVGNQACQLGIIVRTEVLLGYDQERLGIGVRLIGPGS